MGNVEAFEPEHALAPAGKLPARRGAHAADPDHDHVIAVSRRHALSPGSAAALWTPAQGRRSRERRMGRRFGIRA